MRNSLAVTVKTEECWGLRPLPVSLASPLCKNKLPQPQVSPLAPPRALPISCLLMKRANLWPLLPPPYRIPSPWQAGFCTGLLHQIFLPRWQMRLELLNSTDNGQYLTHLTSWQCHCDTDTHTAFPALKISGGKSLFSVSTQVGRSLAGAMCLYNSVPLTLHGQESCGNLAGY